MPNNLEPQTKDWSEQQQVWFDQAIIASTGTFHMPMAIVRIHNMFKPWIPRVGVSFCLRTLTTQHPRTQGRCDYRGYRPISSSSLKRQRLHKRTSNGLPFAWHDGTMEVVHYSRTNTESMTRKETTSHFKKLATQQCVIRYSLTSAS